MNQLMNQLMNRLMNSLIITFDRIYQEDANAFNLDYVGLYGSVYKLIVYNHGHILYDRYLKFLNNYLESIWPSILALHQLNVFQFMTKIINRFEEFEQKTTIMCIVSDY